jgi:multiple sugar transport system substrate-binding protein
MRMEKIGKGILISFLGLCMLFSGCGKEAAVIEKAAAPKKVDIVFWDENAAADRTRYYKVLIRKFESENPDIHVEYVGMPKKVAKLKINTAIATNELPDVCGVQSSWIAEFYDKNVLLKLDPYFNKWEEKDEMLSTVIDANRALAKDGKLYQLPNTMSLEILWYRKDWFDQAKLKPPKAWDEFFADVERMTDREKGHYGFTIRGGDGAGMQLLRMMFAYSGYKDFFTADGKCRINDPKHVEFVKKYLGLYRKYTPTSDITNGYQEMIAAFDTGSVAMVQHNIGSYASHKKFMLPGQYEALILPRAQDGSIMQEANNVDGYGIFKMTHHPEESWRFISFLCSQSSQSYWNKSIGQIPTNKESLKESWVQELPHMQLAAEILSSPKLKFYDPPMYLPNYRSILDSGSPGIQAIMTGQKSVKEFLDEWAGAFEQAKKKYDADAAEK